MNTSQATVLFVDDEERILRSLRMLFRGRCQVLATTSGREALEFVRRQPVHVVVSDQRMPEMVGVELLRGVREASPATMRLLLTGYSDLPAIVASVNDGEIFRFVEKPWQPQYLIETVEQAAEIALAEFAARSQASAAPPMPAGAMILVVDEDPETARLVRELSPESHEVRRAESVESALSILSEHDVAVVVAELKYRQDDMAGVLKTLKRHNPATLAIAVSALRDSRSLIDLINQGQIFRFLPKPLSRELLRRSLSSGLDRHARTRAAPVLLRRHAVEEPKFEAVSLSARFMEYWRRIRDNGRARQSS
ncbi:MAG TPA: response regulator [Rudaea sp.]|nr:response regulator [Rudaea sp.]